MPVDPLNVFINCPFDVAYRPLFEGILFTIAASGYKARCALEEENGADIRLDKLCRIIGECQLSIHDLSRVHVELGEFPRFNMPFELGLMMGAKRFGSKKYKSISALIMVHEAYKMPAYLSDLAGNDPRAHGNDVSEVVRITRGYLSQGPTGAPLPGPSLFMERFEEFQDKIPKFAAELKHKPEEINPFTSFKEYEYILSTYVVNYPVV